MKKNILMVMTNVSEINDKLKTGVWLEEFKVPYFMFKDANFEVTIASPDGGQIPVDPASLPEKPCEKAEIIENLLANSIKLTDLNPEEFDAIVVPGGHGAMFDLAGNIELSKILGLFFFNGKPIATICHGGAALIAARTRDNHPIVEGREVTAYSNEEEKLGETGKYLPFSLEDKLKELGGKYSASKPFTSHVVEEDGLITAQNPASSEDFANSIITKLNEAL